MSASLPILLPPTSASKSVSKSTIKSTGNPDGDRGGALFMDWLPVQAVIITGPAKGRSPPGFPVPAS